VAAALGALQVVVMSLGGAESVFFDLSLFEIKLDATRFVQLG
jgi:hypothetical protein